jgi:hypothetical protein
MAQTDLLVIDGFLDGGAGSCTVVLSRSQNVSDPNKPIMEKGATVQLEDNNGSVYSLKEVRNGNYSVSNVTIDTQIKYRLNIKTEAGKSYQSEYIEIKNTPPIDSVTWKASDQGIQFYVSTHDDEKKSIYYQYRFVETWEYTSAFQSSYKFKNGVVVVRYDDIYHCWTTLNSTVISLATSVKLSQDIISNFPFFHIPKPSNKYLIRYSVLVKQNAITSEAYNYWQQLQKNTEKIGTLFDPQPSQVTSNIQNIDNKDEPVLGYFSAGITMEKRIFVNFAELPRGWFFMDTGYCYADTVLIADVGRDTTISLVNVVYNGSPSPTGYTYSSIECVDCRLAGGTTAKPDFW